MVAQLKSSALVELAMSLDLATSAQSPTAADWPMAAGRAAALLAVLLALRSSMHPPKRRSVCVSARRFSISGLA
jgi:hypothetical protein